MKISWTLHTVIWKESTHHEGMYEPTDTEPEWPRDGKEDDEDLADEVKDKIRLSDREIKDEEKNTDEDNDPPAKGVPQFWLTIFKNVDMFQEIVQEHDEPMLAKLADARVSFNDGSTQPIGFKLHLYFEANEYFTNNELTKEYEMKCVPMKHTLLVLID